MRPTTILLVLLLSATASTTVTAQGAMRAAPSGRGTTAVMLTFVDSAVAATAQPATIRIDYGQPHLRGRALHSDSLVPYDQVWRTGANEPTILATDVDLVLGGVALPKGEYVLETLPSRAGWKLLIRKAPAAGAAGAPANEPPAELARVDLRRTTLPMPMESLTFWLIPSREPGVQRGELRLTWGTEMLATDWAVR